MSKKSALSEALKKLKDTINAPPKTIQKEVDELAKSFKPPVQVSPLLKAIRYGALLCGMVYGFKNHLVYSMEASQYREIENEKKRIRYIEIARERERLNKEETQAFDDWVKANS